MGSSPTLGTMGKIRHEMKFTRKTETHWCTCRKWRMKVPSIPWTTEPSPELVAQTEMLMEEFDKHVKESEGDGSD